MRPPKVEVGWLLELKIQVMMLGAAGIEWGAALRTGIVAGQIFGNR